jgi:hypothetical protein
MEFLRNLFRCVNDPRFRLLTFPERPWRPEYYDLVDERCRAKQLADGVPLEPGAGPWWHDAYWEIYYEVYQPTLTVADYLGNLLFVLGSLSVFVLVAASAGFALFVAGIAVMLSMSAHRLTRTWWRLRIQEHELPNGATRRQKD